MVDALWMMFCTCLVFIMQAGFAMFESGMGVRKNTVNILLKNFIDFLVAGFAFALVGYSILFAEIPLVSEWWFEHTEAPPEMVGQKPQEIVFLFHLMFAGTAVTLVSGAISGRVQLAGYLTLSFFFGGLIYPFIGRLIWGGGFLQQLGFIDFAGGSVVHVSGGAAALAAAVVIGPRLQRFSTGGKFHKLRRCSPTASTLGVFVLWLGWYGFNMGSNYGIEGSKSLVASIGLNTTFAAMAGGTAAVVFKRIQSKFVDLDSLLNGVLAGLVAITAGCAYFTVAESLLIGAIGAALCLVCSEGVERANIDDALSSFAIHAASGCWGVVAIGLLGAHPQFPDQPLHSTGVQSLGVVVVALLSFSSSWIVCQTLKRLKLLRVTVEQELHGLDETLHQHQHSDFDHTHLAHRSRVSDQALLASKLSHEIKTPLTIAKTNIDLLDHSAKKQNLSQTAHESVKRAKEGVNRAISFSKEILKYVSRSNQFTEFSIRKPVEAAVGMCRMSFGDEAKISISDNEFFITANETMLTQCVFNILKNSIEAATRLNRQPSIEIHIDLEQRYVEINDDCGGVSNSTLEKLFNPFESQNPSDKGTGLGLFIAKENIEFCGGQISSANRKGGLSTRLFFPKSEVLSA